MRISVCIPTYNRAAHLTNCLHSMELWCEHFGTGFEICVSDNCSTDDTEAVVRRAQASMPIKYRKNADNLGIPRNFLNVVDMAEGDFVWLVGDDDLLVPDAIRRLLTLIAEHPNVDYFYVNAYHLTTEYVRAFPQPFTTDKLPATMKRFSDYPSGGEMPFLDLVDPDISFDFLGGMFLSVFRRQLWLNNREALDPGALADSRTFSHFDNTFPHVKIFARAFSGSTAFFNPDPMIVCLTGAREWAPMYPLVRSVRLVEALKEYRKAGLPYFKYLRCRNFALRNFLPDLARMLIRPAQSGLQYVSPFRLFVSNLLFPNLYLSPIIDALQRAEARRVATIQARR